jgi:hypothetical protein
MLVVCLVENHQKGNTFSKNKIFYCKIKNHLKVRGFVFFVFLVWRILLHLCLLAIILIVP